MVVRADCICSLKAETLSRKMSRRGLGASVNEFARPGARLGDSTGLSVPINNGRGSSEHLLIASIATGCLASRAVECSILTYCEWVQSRVCLHAGSMVRKSPVHVLTARRRASGVPNYLQHSALNIIWNESMLLMFQFRLQAPDTAVAMTRAHCGRRHPRLCSVFSRLPSPLAIH